MMLSERRGLRTLWWIVAGLLAIHVVLTVTHYTLMELPWLVRQIWDVDEEDSFPTWYSAAALALTAAMLWVHALRRAEAADPWRWHWRGLAGGFLALSIDEVAGMHETLNSVIEGTWVVPALVLMALIGGIYLSFLLHLPRRVAVRFVVAGGIFLGGALGVEGFTEVYKDNDALDTLAYNLWTAVEEGMEMAGVLVFLKALLDHMRTESGALEVLPLHFDLRR